MSRIVPLALSGGVAFSLAGCAGPNPMAGGPEASAGFLDGFIHGFLVLFALVGKAAGSASTYEVRNIGLGYDCGYVLGILAFFGGSGTAASQIGSK